MMMAQSPVGIVGQNIKKRLLGRVYRSVESGFGPDGGLVAPTVAEHLCVFARIIDDINFLTKRDRRSE
jgi:hypothetical protein